ncbi:MAG: heparan N-sulfatase, partial [Fuerstiella sp.]|nr:heparan N-sulfatase [Fuerstiella sp.]
YLYIYNFKSERWPAGTPHKYGKAVYNDDGSLNSSRPGPEHGGYHDIDACPSLTFLIKNRDDDDFGRYLGWSVDKRPTEELFDIKADSACLHNLADDPKMAAVKKQLNQRLMKELTKTNDARVLDGGDVWETYPRISSLRWFETPEWAKQNAAAVPQQEWLDARRPKKE